MIVHVKFVADRNMNGQQNTRKIICKMYIYFQSDVVIAPFLVVDHYPDFDKLILIFFIECVILHTDT